MYLPPLKTAQTQQTDEGKLRLYVISALKNQPVEDATVTISYSGEPDSVIEEVKTDASGMIPEITLPAPPLEYSMAPSEYQPYAEYTFRISREGFEDLDISGAEILPDATAIQRAVMNPSTPQNTFEDIVIPAHTLYGEYPPKIPEDEIKPMDTSGEIVLSRVVIPEYVVVHDGVPTNPSAKDYYVRYRDYIKNVASSEIYATWPADTIRANVLAIMSFTLNRVYTEWYRNKGYDFTITSSTAFDHKWMYGRNIFESISQIVDELFDNYLSRPGVRQPILTQYCDGERVQCPNWMTLLQEHRNIEENDTILIPGGQLGILFTIYLLSVILLLVESGGKPALSAFLYFWSFAVAILSSNSTISSVLYSFFSPCVKINLNSYSVDILTVCISFSVISLFSSILFYSFLSVKVLPFLNCLYYILFLEYCQQCF